MTPEIASERLPGQQPSPFLSEYQSRMLNQAKPEFQQKKASGKRAIAPVYQRHQPEKLQGVGMIVMSNEKGANGGAFNLQTLSRYNGRKRQFNAIDYSA